MQPVSSLCLHLDTLISRAYRPEVKNKHGRKAIEVLPSQIKNKIGEVHKKLST